MCGKVYSRSTFGKTRCYHGNVAAVMAMTVLHLLLLATPTISEQGEA